MARRRANDSISGQGGGPGDHIRSGSQPIAAGLISRHVRSAQQPIRGDETKRRVFSVGGCYTGALVVVHTLRGGVTMAGGGGGLGGGGD